MHKLVKNTRLYLFTYLELIFAFAVNTIVITVNMAYRKGRASLDTYIMLNIFSCLALFVTALGITGIQLIQIYRKKNEIGLRRAVGAGDFDILVMIFKNTLLSILLPTIIGSVLGGILSQLLPIYEALGVEPVLNYKIIIDCVIAILLFTIIAGTVPAIKAVNFNILEALKNNMPIDRVGSKKLLSYGFYLVMAAVIVTNGMINYHLESEYKRDIINMTGSPPSTSEMVPKFSYKDEEGKVLSSEDFLGKSYCLVIYDITCPTSPMVFDYLKELVEEGSITMEDVIPICIDGTLKETEEFIIANNLPIVPLIDYKKSTKWAFKASFVPTVYIIDKDGVISARSIGWTEDMKQYINKEIGESM